MAKLPRKLKKKLNKENLELFKKLQLTAEESTDVIAEYLKKERAREQARQQVTMQFLKANPKTIEETFEVGGKIFMEALKTAKAGENDKS